MDEIFDKLALGQLSDQELKKLEKERLESPKLDEELKLHQTTVEAIRSEGRNMLKSKLEQWDLEVEEVKSTQQTSSKVRPLYQNLLKVAAAVLLIVIPTIFFLTTQQQSTTLAMDYFEPFPNGVISTSRTVEGNPKVNGMLVKAFTYYESGQYQQASITFEEFAKTHTMEANVELYQGISYLALKNLPKASQMLESSMANSKGEFQEAAKWYLALTYLMDGKEKEALKLLDDLQHEGGEFVKKAKVLNDKLK